MKNKSSSLLIVGAGSFSAEVDELARILGYTELVFLDDNISTARSTPVIGTLSDIKKFRNVYPEAIVAFGNNDLRLKFHKILLQEGYIIPSLVHPTAYVSPDATLNRGCIVRAKAVVSRYVELGESCIVNAGALIDHDCIVGDGCHILIGAVVRNKVHIPDRTWVPSNTVVE